MQPVLPSAQHHSSLGGPAGIFIAFLLLSDTGWPSRRDGLEVGGHLHHFPFNKG